MTTASQKVGNYGFLTVSAPGNGTAPTTYSFRSSNGAVNGSINNATAADLGRYTQAPYSGDRTQTILRFANGSQVIVPNGDVQSFTLALVQAVPPVNGKLFDTAVTAGVDKTVTTPAVSTTKPAATTATSTPAPAPAPAPKPAAKPVTTTATSTTPVINVVTPVPVLAPTVIPAPRVLGATITNPFVKPTPAYQLPITNTVPNPVLKPATPGTLNSLITPTPTIKATIPAIIPAPVVNAAAITNPFSKTVPDPNAIVNAVPNPKLNTKVPPGNYIAVTNPPIITAGTPPLVAAIPTDAKLPLSTFPFTPGSGLTGAKKATAVKPTQQDQANFEARKDWRVRLALAPDGPTTKYLYRADEPGILQPLIATDGVVFPYTPTIAVNYSATYDSVSPVHSNYKINQYTSSSVDSVTLTCDFTAQDAAEARYVLAVIHFFRSMTKMFYGQDKMPKNGTPPPLCYLFGLGEFQFSALPLAITAFNYTLPTDVDYIKTTTASPAGSPQEAIRNSSNTPNRLGPNLGPGGVKNPTNYGATPSSTGVSPTYVPTKIQLSITCLPMMSRNMVSNKFSLKDYASGKLLQGTGAQNLGGGMW